MSRRERRPRREAMAPALFPFLAVLVCTMGALVLILVIVVSQASAAARVTLEREADQIQEVSDVVIVASEEMKAQRQKQQEAIDRKRAELAGIEDHITRLIEEMKQLEQTAKAIEEQSAMQRLPAEEDRARREAIEAKIREEEAKLAELQQELKNAKPAFAIIPYQGKNGTNRRPIYLECTGKGVVIQPEQILLPLEDLMPPHGPGNPLDASLRVIRTAFQRAEGHASLGVSPYPLLLVRPDGILSYSLARAAMASWDDQFGYELIGQTMPLAFPPSIPGLGPQIADSLKAARQRQQALLAAMPQRYAKGNDWKELLDEFAPSGSSATSGVGAGGDARDARDWSDIDRSATGQGGTGRAEPSSQGDDSWKLVKEVPFGNSTGEGLEALRRDPNRPSTEHPSLGTVPLLAEAVASDPSHNMGQGGTGEASPSFTPSADSGNPSMGASSAVDGSSSVPNAMAAPSTASAPLAGTTAAQAGLPSNRTSTTETGAGPTDEKWSTPRERDGISQTPTLDLSPGSRTKDAVDDSDKQGKAMPQSWTASRRRTNGTMISRPVKIVAMPDRWLVMREGAEGQIETVIPLDAGPAIAGKKLDEAITARVDSWGVAVAGGYWEPKLIIEVTPYSERSVWRLQKMAEGSGLDCTVQPLR